MDWAPARLAWQPAHLLIPVAAGVSLLGAVNAIDDRSDAFWHVVVGDEIRARRTVTGVGDSWAWFDPPEPWTTSQWLAEVAMSASVQGFGWAALLVGTLLLGAATLALLWVVLRSRASVLPAALVFSAIAVPLSFSLQPRPAIVSLLGAVWAGALAEQALDRGVLPTWWALPIVTLWANLHGAWVVLPLAVGMAVVLRWLEEPRERSRFLTVGAGWTGLLLLAGCLNPLGFGSLLLPIVLRESTQHIIEWQRTAPLDSGALPLSLLILIAVVSWARAPRRVPVSEVVFVVAWVAFGLLAYRNVAIAALVIAPIVARRAHGTFSAASRPTSPREQRGLQWGTIGLAIGSAAWVIATLATTDPLKLAAPLNIARSLATEAATLRVLNHYNSAGVLVAFGPPGLQVGIDGRAERYGSEYIDAYLDVFQLAGDDWRGFLDDFDADAAVAQADQAIVHHLRDDLGWSVTMTDGEWVLLRPARSS